MAATATIQTRSCRWFDGKEVARTAIECGSCAVLRVQVGEQVDYYQVGRLAGRTGCWLVGKMAPDGSEPVFYTVELDWSRPVCSCPDWNYRRRQTGECKHVAFLKAALKSIGIEG